MEILFPEYKKIPQKHWQEAIDKACEFIDAGISEKKNSPKTMDWEQDFNILVPEINKNLGYDIRTSSKETHWWTFLGAYMGIGEGLFSSVIKIRHKKATGKKLEKYEQDFYKENKNLIDFQIKNNRTDEEKRAVNDYFFSHKNKKK